MESGPVEIEAYQSGLTCLLLRTIFCLITQLGELPEPMSRVYGKFWGVTFLMTCVRGSYYYPLHMEAVFFGHVYLKMLTNGTYEDTFCFTLGQLPHLLFFFILGGLIDSIFQSEKPWTGNILGLWFYSTPARGLKFKIYTSEIHNQPQHALSDIYSGSSILYINIRK